eukprot:536201-Prymnesium_polylepis.1
MKREKRKRLEQARRVPMPRAHAVDRPLTQRAIARHWAPHLQSRARREAACAHVGFGRRALLGFRSRRVWPFRAAGA